MYLRSIHWCCLVVAFIIMHEAYGQRPVTWEALKEALREIEHVRTVSIQLSRCYLCKHKRSSCLFRNVTLFQEEAENQLSYGNSEDEREKRGPMNFRFRGAKRFAGDEVKYQSPHISFICLSRSRYSVEKCHEA